jgi:hypothetical protein
MAHKTRTPPPGPLFWHVLVILPGFIASAVGLHQKSMTSAAHTFVLACFSLASLQCIVLSWWQRNVEGDLGMPRFVHVGAGWTEILVIALRAYGLLCTTPEGGCHRHRWSLAVATVVSCGMMGGARWTWFVAVKKPRCFVPAALVLAATILTRPSSMAPALDIAAFAAFLAGNVVAAKIWHFHNDTATTTTTAATTRQSEKKK